MRTIIDLPDSDRERLDPVCRQRGGSRAEGLRQALRCWLDQQTHQHRAVFGLWRDRSDDSLNLQRQFRDAWER